MNVSERTTQNQAGYTPESSTQSPVGSLNNVDFEDIPSNWTKIPEHPSSEQTCKLL